MGILEVDSLVLCWFFNSFLVPFLVGRGAGLEIFAVKKMNLNLYK